ncbi:MAG: dephospho-CoA kinase [Rhodospirillaceae bacterium]|nr:dephospho-CoA kinase [Rhodospirillaceae bacterium]
MVILGLTGSIGMGKSTAAAAFRRLGVPVHDSDAVVHALSAPGGAAVDYIAKAFPETVDGGVIDRRVLAARVFTDSLSLRRLESILHPMVRADRTRFLGTQARRGSRLVVLDIPLLFETASEHLCDGVAVVSAPPFVQRRRVMGRTGMTEERLQGILKQQVPDAEKCRRADFIVQTGLDRGYGLRQVAGIVKVVSRWRGRHWPTPEKPDREKQYA